MTSAPAPLSPRVANPKRTLLINTISGVLSRCVTIGVHGAMGTYLITHAPLEEYALLGIVYGAIALMPLIAGALSAAMARHLTEAHARNDQESVTRIASTLTPILIVVALIVFAMGSLFIWEIQRFVDVPVDQIDTTRGMLLLQLGGGVARLACTPYLLGFYVRQKFVLRDVIAVGNTLLGFGILAHLFTHHEARILWAVVATEIAAFVHLMVVLMVSMRLVPSLRFRYSLMRSSAARPILSFAVWNLLSRTSTWIRAWVNPAQMMAIPGEVAAYELGAAAGGSLDVTPLITSIAEPEAVTLAATERRDRLRRLWYRLCRYGLWLPLAAAVPTAIFRAELFEEWLDKEAANYPLAPLVIAFFAARILAAFPEQGIHMLAVANDRMRSFAWRAVVLDIASILTAVGLVRGWDSGPVGLAGGVLLVTLVGYPCLLWPLGLELAGARFRDWFRECLLPGFLPALVAAPLWVALHLFSSAESTLELGLQFASGWVVYGFALWRVLRPEDRLDLRQLRRWGASKLRRRAA